MLQGFERYPQFNSIETYFLCFRKVEVTKNVLKSVTSDENSVINTTIIRRKPTEFNSVRRKSFRNFCFICPKNSDGALYARLLLPNGAGF